MKLSAQLPTFGSVLRVPSVLCSRFHQESDEKGHSHDLQPMVSLMVILQVITLNAWQLQRACLPLKLLDERESAKDSLLSIKLFQLIRTMQKQHLAPKESHLHRDPKRELHSEAGIINPARGAKRSMAGFRSPAKSRQSLQEI